MNKKQLPMIRVRPEYHRMAKIAACQQLLSLQSWLEQLIEKECRRIK